MAKYFWNASIAATVTKILTVIKIHLYIQAKYFIKRAFDFLTVALDGLSHLALNCKRLLACLMNYLVRELLF